MTEPQPEPPEGTLIENQGVDAGGNAAEKAPRPDAARAGGHPEDAGDDARRSALGTEFDGDPELTGSPDQHEQSEDAGGQDSGSIS